MCVSFGCRVAGVHSEPGLERPEVSAAAVLFDPENRGQGARHPAVQVRLQKTRRSYLKLALMLDFRKQAFYLAVTPLTKIHLSEWIQVLIYNYKEEMFG